VGGQKDVSTLSVTFSEPWIALKDYMVFRDKLLLNFKLQEAGLSHVGAIQSAMELKVVYDDGDVEVYSTTVFVHLSE